MKDKVWIDIFASGHVAIRENKITKGALPCYFVSSKEEAKDLIVFACVLSRDGSGYAMPNFAPSDLNSIDKARTIY